MIVYRSGSQTSDNFTPRPEKDTTSKPGKKPGLSTFETLVALKLLPGVKAHKLDLNLLKPPLQAFPDDSIQGGNPGHVAIAPVTPEGNIDQSLLENWASCRRTGVVHILTQVILDCIVETDIRNSL